jgi:hypothetical protein
MKAKFAHPLARAAAAAMLSVSVAHADVVTFEDPVTETNNIIGNVLSYSDEGLTFTFTIPGQPPSPDSWAYIIDPSFCGGVACGPPPNSNNGTRFLIVVRSLSSPHIGG